MCRQKQYYGFLDLIRVYCAFLVVIIHMGYDNSFPVIPCLTRQGVPFFFLVSGFFFSKKLRKSNNLRQTTIQYIKPILIVYFFWVLLWLPSIWINYSRTYLDAPIMLLFVLVRRFFSAGIAPYWYLLVLAEGSLLLALVIGFRKKAIGFSMCVLGIVLNILFCYQEINNPTGLIYRVFYTVFSWNCNVIMSGFPLLFLGALFDFHENIIRRANFWIILVLYIASIAAAFLIFQIDKNLLFIPFGIIQAVLLFFLCLAPIPFLQNLPQNACRFARNLSSVIFLTHAVILAVLGNELGIWNSPLRIGITILCALGLYLLAEKVNVRVLNMLLLLKPKKG